MFHNIHTNSFLLGVTCVVYPIIAYILYIFHNYDVILIKKVKQHD